MKRAIVFFIAVLLVAACSRKDSVNESSDPFNGYSKYLKSGEVIKTLWAGQHIDVGTVTYGIDANANFYITYDCTPSGWVISETHNFSGAKIDMPVNKPGKPKIGHFPNSEDHSPRVSTYTYTIPLNDLPPAEDPGFVVASHAVVHSPNGQNETAWAEGDYKFTDKGWGWYDVYYYNQPDNPFTMLYGTQQANDSLYVFLIDITNGKAELTLTEYVGNAPGSYDGTAFDLVSSNLFFTNYNTDELFVNELISDNPSFSAGSLDGKAASATFYDDEYYYVDENQMTINNVSFDNNWQIVNEVILSSIPNSVTITDIAMSPVGDKLFMVGDVDNDDTELITWDIVSDTYATIDLPVSENTQIAYGTDGLLYAVSPDDGSTGEVTTYVIDTDTGVVNVINGDDAIIVEPPFSDISKGPLK